ncbi:MAG: thiamine-binding protein [Egibacteraceae bacterium]
MHLWFSVTPVGTASASVSAEVATAVAAVRATGVRCTTDASGTLVEGSWEECQTALRAACDAVLATTDRVSITAKYDVRNDKPSQDREAKLASLEQAMEERGEP